MFNRRYHSLQTHRSLIIMSLAIALLVLSGSFAFAEDLAPTSEILASTPSCRYGAATFGATQSQNWAGPLNLGWHVNFQVWGTAGPETLEFVPIIRLKQQKIGCTRLPGYDFSPALTDDELGAAIRSRPGALWIVGNEPDRGPNPEDTACTDHRSQDDTAPEVYARAYAEAYAFIKRTDPTAQVASAGLVQVTPGRLQYWEIVWLTYRSLYGTDMPVDAWSMHLYVLPEASLDGRPNSIANVAIGTDPALAMRESWGIAEKCPDPNVYCYAEHDNMAEFARQIVMMRQWMKDHGQQNKPLLLTEYSILYPHSLQDEYGNTFTPERVAKFADDSLRYLDTAADPTIGYPKDGNRLVQRWLWFSVQLNGVGYVSNLLNNALTDMTLVGQAFVNRSAAAPRTLNLFPKLVYGTVGLGSNGNGTRNAMLTAEVRNAGSIPTASSFTVRFYRDAGLTSLIGSATVPANLSGCESDGAEVHVVWPDLMPGEHPFWAKVDADGVIGETQENDNVIQGKVRVFGYGLALPLVPRNVR